MIKYIIFSNAPFFYAKYCLNMFGLLCGILAGKLQFNFVEISKSSFVASSMGEPISGREMFSIVHL